MASRKLPPAARAMTVSDASATSMPSCAAMPASTPTTSMIDGPAEVEALAAREDGGRHLVRLGGGQDEDGVHRRLLQGLEQRVEGLGGEHVHLVDDVDLHAAFHRGEVHLVAQVADVVDAAVGGGVHLDDVHGAAPADGLAVRAGAVGVGGGLALAGVAVEGHGQDLGGGGLARAARTGEEIGVAHPVLVDGVDERAGDVLLPDDVLEAGRPVLAVEGDCHAPGGSLILARESGAIISVASADSPLGAIVQRLASTEKRTVHPPSKTNLRAPAGSRLKPSYPTAHERVRLGLLPPGPDPVHGVPLRRTWPSTPLTGVRPHRPAPRVGIQPR